MKIVYGTVIVNGKEVRRAIALENRKCEECNKEYEPKQQRSKYCSRECAKKGEVKSNAENYKQRAMEWYRDNLDRARVKRKAQYWADPEGAKEKVREWRIKNADICKIKRAMHKDKIRHGKLRVEIIKKQNGLCYMCGKNTLLKNKDAHVHHYNFDKDHEHQVLVCNSCHAKIHLHGHSLKKYISPTTT